MKKIKSYYLLLPLLLLLLLVLGYSSCSEKKGVKQIPRMRPSYSYKDKTPLGLEVAHHLLQTQFDGKQIKINKEPFDKQFSTMSFYDKNVVVVLFVKRLIMTDAEVTSMLNFVSKGNTVFIAAESIDTTLTNYLDFKSGEGVYDNMDAMLSMFDIMHDDTIKILDPNSADSAAYSFYYYPQFRFLQISDSSKIGVFGTGSLDSANYGGIDYGKGHIWIHSNPLLFSNYFLLTKNNKEYFEKVFSYINNKPIAVFWDDYYHTVPGSNSSGGKGGGGFSALQKFFKSPPLTWALLLALALMLLYIAFASKRKQRIIPVLEPNVNASVSFVQTVGLLYLQKKDNRNIALKMITYFFEHVRSHYFLATNVINDEFIKALSRKSGVSEEKTKELTSMIETINDKESINDTELLSLHNRIQEFYKRS